jgi:hypothetical protein
MKSTDSSIMKGAFERGLSVQEYEALILQKPTSALSYDQPLNPKRPPGTVIAHPKPI